MEKLKLNIWGMVKYRGQEGQLSFVIHRLTGLGTLFFLAITSWIHRRSISSPPFINMLSRYTVVHHS